MSRQPKLTRKERRILAHLQRVQERAPSASAPLAMQSLSVMQEARFSGPMPPPDMLASYDATVPGLGDRIVQMAEREQAHRHKCDVDALKEFSSHRMRGQVLGFLLGATCLATAMVAAHFDQPTIGTAAITAIAVVVTTFVLHRRHLEKQDDNGDGR